MSKIELHMDDGMKIMATEVDDATAVMHRMVGMTGWHLVTTEGGYYAWVNFDHISYMLDWTFGKPSARTRGEEMP